MARDVARDRGEGIEAHHRDAQRLEPRPAAQRVEQPRLHRAVPFPRRPVVDQQHGAAAFQMRHPDRDLGQHDVESGASALARVAQRERPRALTRAAHGEELRAIDQDRDRRHHQNHGGGAGRGAARHRARTGARAGVVRDHGRDAAAGAA